MRRREVIVGISGAAAWPFTMRAQERERIRRIGILAAFAADDPEGQDSVAAFLQGLQELGWTVGRNVQIVIRWGAGDADLYRKYAAELVALAPDAILANGTVTLGPLHQLTRTTPIVFVFVPDPVGGGWVAIAMARPGGNITGFTTFEYSTSGKWLELLKEIAPRVMRVAVIRDPTIPGAVGQFAAIQTVAPSLGVEVSPVRHPRRCRDRARRCGIRPGSQSRPDFDAGRIGRCAGS